MAPKGKIPDRWIPYKACGEVIEGTRIICFKVPIDKRVQQNVREIKEIWDIPAVLAAIPKLGAVVDLTNTGRYYEPSEFEQANVRHKKIFMPGREIPPESKVQEFMDAVDEFLGRDCDSLIGVHCTHGLNRTGYMVCRYLRDRLNMPAEDAITKFEKARGYEIERENYRADLLGKEEIPRSDFGKETLIKPINKETELGTSRDYDRRNNGRHKRYESNRRYSNDRNGDRYGGSSRYSIRNGRCEYSENITVSGRNGYLSWRRINERDSGSSNNWRERSPINGDGFDSDNSSSGRSEHGFSFKHDY